MKLDIADSNLLLPVFLSLVAICSFAWALRGHFMTVGRIPKGMRLLSVASLISYVIYLGLLFYESNESIVTMIPGVAGLTASIVLFWWTVSTTRSRRLRLAYTDADPDILNTDGPYAFVRHPFYLSYIIFWISTALLAGSWQWMPALTLSLWYVHVAKGEERRFGSSNLSLAYSRYRLQTGMLLPRLRRHHRFFNQSAQMRNELLEQACGPRSPPAVAVPAAEAGNHPPDRSQH